MQSEFTYLSTKAWWPDWAASGINDVVPVVVVIVALFVLGKNLPTRAGAIAPKLPPAFVPRWRPVPAAIAVAAVLVALVVTGNTYRFGIITSMIMAIISLSLVLLTGFAGQVSLAQAAFAGTGGFVLSRLATDAHVPFPFSLILGALRGERRRRHHRRPRAACARIAARRRHAGRGGRRRAVHLRQSGHHSAPRQPGAGRHACSGIDLAVRRKGDLVRLPFGDLRPGRAARR